MKVGATELLARVTQLYLITQQGKSVADRRLAFSGAEVWSAARRRELAALRDIRSIVSDGPIRPPVKH